MREGRIIKGIGGFYYIDSGRRIYECKARGIFRKNNTIPMVGDFVVFSILDEDKGVIEDIKERKNQLIRPPVANVDQVIVVFAVTQPEPNLSLLDRFLVLAEREALDIIICFNKTDLMEEYQWMQEIYAKAGYKIIATTKTEKETITQLNGYMSDRVTVMAGPSGVGKSTILNNLQSNIKLQTGEISSKSERGKHTTRHVELIPLNNGGWVVDTPGFSSLKLDFLETHQLAGYYREFLNHMEKCRFTTCLHDKEPECGVKAAVENEKIDKTRYQSYLQLLEEIKSNRRY